MSSLQRAFTLKIPKFDLEHGSSLHSIDVRYKTWGTLNTARNNVMVICHPFTASIDVEEWWIPLLGYGKAFDPTHFFIFCANVLGSPFGTASPLSYDASTGKRHGRDFPSTTIRDDVRLHKLVLDHLGVTSVAVVIGGSMGGMTALEWPLCFPDFVRRIIPMATCAKQSAWCIAWGEVMRQIISSDAAFKGGDYTRDRPPTQGLAVARMAGLLTYRSSDSYAERFGRALESSSSHPDQLSKERDPDDCRAVRVVEDDAGHPFFSAQSYLRYKGVTFASAFDANCYIHLTHKMDTHDIARGRADEGAVLRMLPARALIISIASDVLCPPTEQQLLAEGIPEAELVVIPSIAGHDGFLVESARINEVVSSYLRRELGEFYEDEMDFL
ncbi:Alpha/Beta hydrolase protein [Mycena polygramma]|nr:Alpha/Beta hydrolase protein [Mycena polygramma]